jgi:hypothetical protein
LFGINTNIDLDPDLGLDLDIDGVGIDIGYCCTIERSKLLSLQLYCYRCNFAWAGGCGKWYNSTARCILMRLWGISAV